MNINLIKLKGILIELRAIHSALDRLADCKEMELAQLGLHLRPPIADTRGEKPELMYTDEEDDAIRELELAMGMKSKTTEEDEDQHE